MAPRLGEGALPDEREGQLFLREAAGRTTPPPGAGGVEGSALPGFGFSVLAALSACAFSALALSGWGCGLAAILGAALFAATGRTGFFGASSTGFGPAFSAGGAGLSSPPFSSSSFSSNFKPNWTEGSKKPVSASK